MKRTNFCVLASALALLGGSTAAVAQTPTPIGVTLRAGIVFPTDSDTSNTFGSTWFGFGAEYNIYHLPKVGTYNSGLSISIDYFSRNDLDETPVMLNYYISSGSVFGDVGLGASFDHIPGSTDTEFEYQVGLGYNLPVPGVPVFVEAKFWGADDSKYDAIGLYAGVRF